jgi:hypothetical protein
MKKLSPKTQMLVLGGSMVLVAGLWTGGAAMILPWYFKLKNGSGDIPREHMVGLIRDFLGISFVMAIFLNVCARAVFRHRKRLKDE